MTGENITQSSDVIVIGGGLAGASAATVLSRRGFDVVLISASDKHPADFRAEKMGEAQMMLFDRLGLGEAVRRTVTAFDGVWLFRFGRLVKRSLDREYGFNYPDLVNALIGAMPPAVRRIVGRVDDVALTPDRQGVTLTDGRRFEARLVVVSTGLGEAVRKKLGIERDIVAPNHSLCCGFDLAQPASTLPFPSLVWSSGSFGDGLSYLTLFPIGDRTRANLFLYRDLADSWVKEFRKRPQEMLREMLPGLAAVMGPMELAPGNVVVRPIDLIRAREPERDGVVLIGDAFFSICPITGTGIDKAITDVDRLCEIHVPEWMATPGMGVDKIGRFYSDPVKAARDISAWQLSLDSRSIKTDTSLYWRLRRLRSRTLGQPKHKVKALIENGRRLMQLMLG